MFVEVFDGEASLVRVLGELDDFGAEVFDTFGGFFRINISDSYFTEIFINSVLLFFRKFVIRINKRSLFLKVQNRLSNLLIIFKNRSCLQKYSVAV